MKPLHLDGITYDADVLRVLIAEMIALRDEALKLGEFGVAITCSHVIACLNYQLVNLDGTLPAA